jgi:hypothetical protein
MRRTRSLLLAASAGVALIASACGVTADTTAATVEGRDIPAEDVSALLADPAFTPGPGTGNESTERGSEARSALSVLIEREVWLAELDRWGVQITDADRATAAQELDQQLSSSGTTALKSRTREIFVEYLAAQAVLGKRFATLSPDDDADLRRLYESSELQFRQVCLTVVQVPAEGIRAAQDRIDDGIGVEGLVDAVQGAELVADPSQGCYAEVGLAAELRTDLEQAPIGVTRGVVLTSDGNGGVTAYAYRLEGRDELSFDEVREDLAAAAEGLAQQGPAEWVQLLALGAEVNPRYGQGVVRTANGFSVLAPQRPEAPVGERLTAAIAAAAAAEQAAAAQAGGAADAGAATSGG